MKRAYAIFFLLMPLLFQGQTFQPHSINYSVEEGVPSSECYEVMQDSKGFIWIATDKGICKFNGYAFTKYTSEDGLPDNTIFGFFEDSKKRLWGRTLSGGLFYIDNDSIRIPKFNETLKKKILPYVITAIRIRDDDSVFFETKELMLFATNCESTEIRKVVSVNNTMSFLNRKALIFWNAGASSHPGAPLKLNIEYDHRTISFEGKESEPGLLGQKTTLKNKGFMFSVDNKLLYYDEHSDGFIDIDYRTRILSVFEDKSGGIWISTLNDGVYYYKYGIRQGLKRFFEGESITSFCEDNEGGIWTTTLKSGVYYIPNKDNLSIKFAKEAFNVIERSGNDFVGGSKNGNVYFFDSVGIKDMVSISPSLTKGNSIYDFCDMDASTLYAAGIYCFRIDKKTHATSLLDFRIGKSILANYSKCIILNVNKDTMYTFSYAGIVITALKDPGRSYSFPFAKVRIISIHCTKKNQLFLGTAFGLYLFQNGKYISLAKHKLLENRINDIASWDDKLLLATNGAGVLFVDLAGNTVKQLTEADGLSSNLCQKVLIDHNTVWVSTNKGITLIDLTNKGFGNKIRRIDKYDGLPGEEINKICVNGDNVWVASNSGISCFSKKMELRNDVKPQIYFDFLKTNKGIYTDSGKKLTFNHDENYIEIDFYGLSFRSLKNLKYKYKLSGIDETWHYTSEPKIIYPSLSGGNFNFEVYAINSDGICSATPAVISFEIVPPFWKELWFIIAIILLVLFLAMLLFKYRINVIKEQELKNADLHKTFLNLKLKALRAQMNPHFTFNVMNSIQHFILTQDEESAHRYMSKFSKLIRAILNNSEKNTIPVAEEIKALELYLDLEAMRFDESFSYEIIIDKTIDPEVIGIPSMLIQPYVENAIMHGILPLKAKGKIKVEITLHNNLLKCIIEDNGIGRAKSAEQNKNRQHKSMGISLTTERLIVINELNSSNLSEKIIDLTDVNGNASGTRVEIYIPIN